MDDDFGIRDRGRETETGAWGAWGGHHGQAMTDQGYEEPFDRSPVPTPPGWYGGNVKQTGGMVMVRTWHTTPEPPGHMGEKVAGEHVYEVGYNARSKGVQLTRYRWDPESGYYIFDDVVEQVRVPRRTDHAQAEAARELMGRHLDKASG